MSGIVASVIAKKRARSLAPIQGDNPLKKAKVYRAPNPADCID